MPAKDNITAQHQTPLRVSTLPLDEGEMALPSSFLKNLQTFLLLNWQTEQLLSEDRDLRHFVRSMAKRDYWQAWECAAVPSFDVEKV